jgi:soluble lytic murein transglycosylase
MTPPAASLASRRASRRRRTVTRRRWALLVLAFVLIGVAVVATAPLFRKTINEFTLPLDYQDVIRTQATDKHLDPALVAAVIYAETKFDPRPSAAGAEGLMQIMPETARFLAHRSGATTFTESDLGTPAVNIAYGTYYLRYLLDEYGQNKILALAAYNAGEANVNRWVAAARANDRKLAISDIPFPETRDYVLRVLHAQRDYRHTYATELGYR